MMGSKEALSVAKGGLLDRVILQKSTLEQQMDDSYQTS